MQCNRCRSFEFSPSRRTPVEQVWQRIVPLHSSRCRSCGHRQYSVAYAHAVLLLLVLVAAVIWLAQIASLQSPAGYSANARSSGADKMKVRESSAAIYAKTDGKAAIDGPGIGRPGAAKASAEDRLPQYATGLMVGFKPTSVSVFRPAAGYRAGQDYTRQVGRIEPTTTQVQRPE